MSGGALNATSIPLAVSQRLSFCARHRWPSGFVLDVAFEVGGGVTGLFGPSGSGKSTVLSILAGTLRPREGTVVLNGRTLLDTARGTFLPPEQRSIGLIFQDHLLFPHLSVEANLRYGQRRRPARAIDFDQLVDLLELRDLLPRLPHTLSGGQRQRVALGRAILRGPQFLLMDEPLSALDAALKDRILSYLARSLSQWHIPTILVSHDQSDMRRLADEVVVLEAGRVVATGPTAQALDRAVLTRLAAAPGPVNLLRLWPIRTVGPYLEGRVGAHWLRVPGSGSAEIPPPGDGPLLVRFLPHDVMLARSDVSGISVRNHLPGVVRETIRVDGRVFVAVDVGQFLWAEVTPEAAAELQLAPGATVVCLIKTSALQPIG